MLFDDKDHTDLRGGAFYALCLLGGFEHVIQYDKWGQVEQPRIMVLSLRRLQDRALTSSVTEDKAQSRGQGAAILLKEDLITRSETFDPGENANNWQHYCMSHMKNKATLNMDTRGREVLKKMFSLVSTGEKMRCEKTGKYYSIEDGVLLIQQTCNVLAALYEDELNPVRHLEFNTLLIKNKLSNEDTLTTTNSGRPVDDKTIDMQLEAFERLKALDFVTVKKNIVGHLIVRGNYDVIWKHFAEVSEIDFGQTIGVSPSGTAPIA